MAGTYHSMNEYVADGTQTEFELSFSGGYISQDHVSAGIGDGKDDNGDLINQEDLSFTWVGPNQISITPAPAAGKLLRIYRETPTDTPLTDFTDSAIITEEGLDLNAKQAVFLAAELRDRIGTIPGWDSVLRATSAAEAAVTSLDSLVDELAMYGLGRVYDKWETLAAVTPTAGATALVLIEDGSHTDPVTTATVDNSGWYRASLSPLGWERFADTQAGLAAEAALSAQNFATALAIYTAGGWYDSLAAGAADPAVAEGEGYLYITGNRVYFGRKVGGVGVEQAELLTSAASLDAILGAALNALSPLTPEADKVAYYTGASSAALTDLTAAGRSVIGAANASAQRTALGLAVGSDVQAYSSNLSALAGVGATSYGRDLLTLADQAALRSLIGIVMSGSAASGKLTVGPITLSWRDHVIGQNATASYGYGDGHTYSSWARAWVEGDDSAGDRSISVLAHGLSTATVRSNGNSNANGVLFAIGV